MADDPEDPDMDPEPSAVENRGGLIVVKPLDRALGERYLTYALSTIMHRALPDARDGLKPVHRRILYGMRGLRLDPNGAFRKCAKIVGEVMGSYHPHGNQAIYDALARLAQDFSVRYPLVDGQGNFGNIDGDNPAAERYTEARMTAAAAALLEGLGPIGASSTVSRLRHFATVFGLIPYRRLNSAIEACDRCIAARTACVVAALPWSIWPIAPPWRDGKRYAITLRD